MTFVEELPETQPSRGEDIKQPVGAKDTKEGVSKKEASKRLGLAPGVVQDTSPSTSESDPSTSKNKLRLAPSVAQEGHVSSSDTNSSIPTGKLRLAPGAALETALSSDRHRGLRLAPGVAPEDETNSSDDEDILVEAAVALDIDDMVEVEMQRMMEEQRQRVVVAEEVTGESPEDSENDIRDKQRKRLLVFLAVGCLAAVAISVGILLSSAGDSSMTTGPTTLPPTSMPAVSSAPSPSPTVTSLRSKVENILSDYAPLDDETMTWLTETSTWEPDEDDPNYEYLWLERYTLAFLYLSTNGKQWSDSFNWLSSESVCKWWFRLNPRCNFGAGPITVLDLRKSFEYIWWNPC